VKESDRLAGTAALLKAAGVRVDIEGDDLLVHGTGGAVPGGGLAVTQMDHRLAMSALVLGLAARAPMTVDDGAFISTSFPGFAALVNRAAGGAAIGEA
jgi:3-phosphoshikimate 1-carboxyvinyltransferase